MNTTEYCDFTKPHAVCRRRVLIIACLGSLLCGLPQFAQPAPVQQIHDPLEPFNRFTFQFNARVHESLDQIGSWLFSPQPSPRTGSAAGGFDPRPEFGNMASNIINEPVTIISRFVIGDIEGVWNAGARFSINTTVGLLGTRDVAADLGFTAEHIDLGLALCSLGVPSGPYLMSPFIGPRTVRDALADILLMNLILYSSFHMAIGPTSGIQAFLIVEGTEVIADTFGTRQIDQQAKRLAFLDYEIMRSNYLILRNERCLDVRRRMLERSLYAPWFEHLLTTGTTLSAL